MAKVAQMPDSATPIGTHVAYAKQAVTRPHKLLDFSSISAQAKRQTEGPMYPLLVTFDINYDLNYMIKRVVLYI
jgi:hypothetical protein